MAQMVEQLFCNQRVVGSSPTASIKKQTGVAQWIEQQTSNLKVVGSSPTVSV